MKAHKTVFSVLICCFPYFASARLGDTPAQLSKRIGDGLRSAPSKSGVAGTVDYFYEKDGFHVSATFWNGKCCCEHYVKLDGSEISRVEIQGLLKANSLGAEWREDAGTGSYGIKHWLWGDKVDASGNHGPVLEAAYMNRDLFFQTTTYKDAFLAADKKKAENGVRGF